MAKPITVHTHVPAPIHWQEKVNGELDRDMRHKHGKGAHEGAHHLVQ